LNLLPSSQKKKVFFFKKKKAVVTVEVEKFKNFKNNKLEKLSSFLPHTTTTITTPSKSKTITMGNILTVHSTKPVAAVLVRCDADPRSPTTAFRRTPLRAIRGTVPDLKDPRSPRCNRTPLRLAVDLDPRERTAGIIRTPVPASDSTFVDPREPTEGLVRTPVPERRSVRRRLQLGADADEDSIADTNSVCDQDDVAVADGFVSISLEDSVVDDDDDDQVDDLLDGFDSAQEDDQFEDDIDSDTETEVEDDDDVEDVAADSEVAHLFVYRSPMPKIRSVQSSRLPKQFASARNHDSLRKTMAMQMTSSPVRHGSPCAVRLVASCPSSPVAA
jgi:hypothetical protein